MNINLRKASDLLVADILRPEGSIRQVETLLGGVAVDGCGSLLAFERVAQCGHSHAQTTLIGDILTERQATICEDCGLVILCCQHLDSVELLDEHLGTLVESLCVGCGPPIVQVAVLVELATLIVETVSHLVTDHNADSTIVHCVVSLRVVEGRLQNCCGEADLVGGGVVVGVHGLGRHKPLVTIDGLTQLSEVVGSVPSICALDVLPVRDRGVDFERRVILPLVGVADLNGERCELLLSASLRFVAHPLQSLDVLTQSHLQVLHQLGHTHLVLLGEVFRYIHLTYGLAQNRVGHTHSALPAGTLLLCARHLTTEEVERCGVQFVVQVRRCATQATCCQVVLYDLDRGRFEQLVHCIQHLGLTYDHLLEIGDADSSEVAIPIDRIVTCNECLAGSGVVVGVDVAQLNHRAELLSHLALEVENCRSLLSCTLDLGHLECLGHKRNVTLALRGVLLVEVVVAVTHTEARLLSVESIHGAVHHIGINAQTKQRVAHAVVQLNQHGNHRLQIGDGVDLRQILLHGSQSLLVQAHRVHTELVEIRDLLLDRTGLSLHRRHRLEELVDLLFVCFAQHIERAVTRELGLQRVLLLPAAGCVLVEVLVQRDRLIEIGGVDCGHALALHAATCAAYHCGCRNEYHQSFHFVVECSVSKKGRTASSAVPPRQEIS